MYTRHPMFFFRQFVWYALLAVEVFLVIRLFAQVIVPEMTSIYAVRIVEMTDPLIWPLGHFLPNTLATQLVTFAIMVAYWVVAFILMLGVHSHQKTIQK